eukprot:81052-Chlamydomonas_euryale.AAC.1
MLQGQFLHNACWMRCLSWPRVRAFGVKAAGIKCDAGVTRARAGACRWRRSASRSKRSTSSSPSGWVTFCFMRACWTLCYMRGGCGRLATGGLIWLISPSLARLSPRTWIARHLSLPPDTPATSPPLLPPQRQVAGARGTDLPGPSNADAVRH